MSVIRVLLVNEIRLMGNIISSTLDDEADIRVVGTVTTVEAALNRALEADVILISTRLPDHGALELTQTLAEEHPSIKVLVLGLAESEAEILQYIETGASGYVLKDDSVDELLKNVRAAHKDEALVSPEIAAALMSRVTELAQVFPGTPGLPESVDLTPRERDVLQLVAQNLSNQEIADRLVIQVGTVKNHVHSILQKLNASNRQDAAVYWSIIKDNQ